MTEAEVALAYIAAYKHWFAVRDSSDEVRQAASDECSRLATLHATLVAALIN